MWNSAARPSDSLLTQVLARYDERQARESTLCTSWLDEAHGQAGYVEHAASIARWSAARGRADNPVLVPQGRRHTAGNTRCLGGDLPRTGRFSRSRQWPEPV